MSVSNVSVLELRALSKSFGGVHAVRDVSLTIGKGEFLAMIGPNGANRHRRNSSTAMTVNSSVSTK